MTKNGSAAVKGFHARLPIESYQKLRALAGMSPMETVKTRQSVLLRMSPSQFEELRQLALHRTGQEGRIVPLQEVIVSLIDKAPQKKRGASLQSVLLGLIEKECAQVS